MTEVAEHETDSEDVGAPVPPDDPPNDETDAEEAEAQQEAGETDGAPPAALSEKEIEKANKALEREATAHANRISKIMGEAAQDLVPCELCWELTPGFHWPNEAVPMPDAQREAVLAAIGFGEGAARKLNPAQGVRECDACGGYGQLEFPTKVPHVKEQSCPKCNASGYVTADQPAPPALALAPTTVGTGMPPPAGTIFCALCGQAVTPGQGHWCVPVANAGG